MWSRAYELDYLQLQDMPSLMLCNLSSALQAESATVLGFLAL